MKNLSLKRKKIGNFCVFLAFLLRRKRPQNSFSYPFFSPCVLGRRTKTVRLLEIVVVCGIQLFQDCRKHRLVGSATACAVYTFITKLNIWRRPPILNHDTIGKLWLG